MNESAYYVISKAGGTPYAGTVAEKQKHLNDCWRALCQQLGITYKKAEETRYGLKLLEIQLKQLNTWMTDLESRLVDFTVARLCVVAEINKKVKEMKVKLKTVIVNMMANGPFAEYCHMVQNKEKRQWDLEK